MSETRTSYDSSATPFRGPNLKAYEGQWAVLHQDAVIEHGADLVEIAARARTRGILCPRVLYVELHREGEAKLGNL